MLSYKKRLIHKNHKLKINHITLNYAFDGKINSLLFD